RLDDAAHLAHLEGERGVGELGHHRAALEHAEVAAALGRAGLVAALDDDLVELGAAADLREALLGPLPRRLARALDAGRLALRSVVHDEHVLRADRLRLALALGPLALEPRLLLGHPARRRVGEPAA